MGIDSILDSIKRDIGNLGVGDELPWVFPKCGNVKGFYGDDPVVFLCPNPSFGKMGDECEDRHLKFFYGQLEVYGFANAHLTDLVKTRVRDFDIKKVLRDKTVLERNLPILKRELDEIRPSLIVLVGESSWRDRWGPWFKRGWGSSIEDFLIDCCPLAEIIGIVHYSQQAKVGERRDELINKLKELDALVHS
ncbi:MAG: hypothetical protein JXB14_00720 [Candidatus Altiarchaeota archaeon]|nr:hypothetical protein [Candidatus Altiarchaeota archaeon]